MGSFFKLLRPHQWVKNMLIFVPLITAHQLFNPHIFRIALVSAVTFSGVRSTKTRYALSPGIFRLMVFR